jgi:hypothetical protein
MIFAGGGFNLPAASKDSSRQAASSLAGPEFFANALARLGGKAGGRSLGEFLGMVMGGVLEKTDLPAILAAPFAELEMQPQTGAARGWQGMLQGLGLQPERLPAGRHEPHQGSRQGVF